MLRKVSKYQLAKYQSTKHPANYFHWVTFQFLCWKSNQWLRTHPAQMIGRQCLQCSACVCSHKGGSFSTIGRSISLFVRFIFPEANNPNRFKILITDWCFGNLGTRVWNVWQLIKIDVFDSDFREVDAFCKKSSNCLSLHLPSQVPRPILRSGSGERTPLGWRSFL